MKVGLSGVSLAMQARPDLAASVAPLLAERLRREWKRLEGAEILWVDDRPSRNRLEARMFQGFGARVTFAASSEEAQDALGAVALGRPPFDLIISNIGRSGRDEGLEMLEHFRAAGVSIPMVFYVGRLQPGLPKGAQGITNRPDELAGLVLDALDRRDPR
jgi:CheY-like chemotaxis protein